MTWWLRVKENTLKNIRKKGGEPMLTYKKLFNQFVITNSTTLRRLIFFFGMLLLLACYSPTHILYQQPFVCACIYFSVLGSIPIGIYIDYLGQRKTK